MKAKVSRGKGFLGVLNYVFDVGPKATGDKKPEKVGGNVSGSTPQELSREFGITKKLRPDCKNPVWHCSLALPEGDRLSAEKWGELALDFMREMGMDPSNFLYEVVRHNDTKYDHIHLIASRIGLDSSLWHGGKDVFTAIEATQRLEKKHGLTLTPGFDPEHKKERKSITAEELNMAIRTETKPPRMICQDAIDAVLQLEGVISAPQFIERLEARGVLAVPNIASTGTMNGYSFKCEGISFTGTKLGESYKWAALQKRGVEYVQTRDFETLADAKRCAFERSGTGPDAGQDQRQAGRNSEAGERFGAVTSVDRRPSESVARTTHDDSSGRGEGAGGLRPGDQGTEVEFGGHGHGNRQSDSGGHGAESAGVEHGNRGAGWPGEGSEIEPGQSGGQQPKVIGIARESEQRSQECGQRDAEQQPEADSYSTESSPVLVVNPGSNVGQRSAGSVVGGGWASRFKQASASRRDAAKRGIRSESVEQSHGGGKKVAESDRIEARTIDPTGYLESQGFDVKKEGRHLSVRQHGDEMYRCTRRDDGHWVTCDKYENGIGDNIALIQELEPGIGFAESVYRLSGAPSVVNATRPTPAPVVRVPPKMPAQDAHDVKRGRSYLFERGITLETIELAEKAGMLRYSFGGVLFVGRDDQGTAQNVMRRSIDSSETVQKRDLFGTDKRHPQMLLGVTDTVLIVEGGTDALAAVDIARREKRPAPTVLVSGGANVRGFMQTSWVQKILKLANKIIVAFERESTPEAQAKTDAAHLVQMQRLQEVCSAQVVDWKPPEGIKDMAALNLDQVQQIEATHTKERFKDSFPAG